MPENDWKLIDHGEFHPFARYTIETLLEHPTDTNRVATCTVATCYQKEYADQIMREHAIEQQFSRPAGPTKTLAGLKLAGLSDHIFHFIISRSGIGRTTAYMASYMAALAVRAAVTGEAFRLTEGNSPISDAACACDAEAPCVYHRNEHPFVAGDHRECGPDCAITGDLCCGGPEICATCQEERTFSLAHPQTDWHLAGCASCMRAHDAKLPDGGGK